MSNQKYITEHLSRIKYLEVKNLPKTTSSPALYTEKPPKDYLVKFTINPVETFEGRISSHKTTTDQDQYQYQGTNESVKRHGFQEVHQPYGDAVMSSSEIQRGKGGHTESVKRSGFGGQHSAGFRQQDNGQNSAGFKQKESGFAVQGFNGGFRQREDDGFNLNYNVQGSGMRVNPEFDVEYRGSNIEGRKRGGLEIFEENRGYGTTSVNMNRFNADYEMNQQKIGGFNSDFNINPKINIMGPHNESVKRSHYVDKPAISYESVKRSGIELDLNIGGDKPNLVAQIEMYEKELKRLRDQMHDMEGENMKAKHLISENERLAESVQQYRHSITVFTDLERVNRELVKEIEDLKHRLQDYEFHLADKRDIEVRLQEEYNIKLQSELGNFDKLRRELDQYKGLEEKFFMIQSEKLSLEEEIEKIRMIKITLESQLEKLRNSYQEIEEDITVRVKGEYEARIDEMNRKMEKMTKELAEKETRIRANFDRELLELNAINRDLRDQLGSKDERIKRSGLNEKGMNDMRERINAISAELDRERAVRIEIELKFKNLNENYQHLLQEQEHKEQLIFDLNNERKINSDLNMKVENLKIQLESRGSISPEKERYFEQVVQELERVNQALKLLIVERENLKRELSQVKASNEATVQLKLELDGAYREKEAMNIRINELMRTINGLKGEIDNLRREKSNVSVENQLRFELDGLNGKLTEISRINVQLRGDLDMNIREKESIQMKCVDLIAKLKEYENLTENLRSEHDKVKRSGVDQDRARRAIEEDLIALRNENSQLKERQGYYFSLEKEKDSLQLKLNEIIRTSNIMKQDFEVLLREKEGLMLRLRDFEGRGAQTMRLEEENTILRKEKNQMVDRIREFEGRSSQSGRLDEENKALRLEKNQLMDRVNDVTRNLNSYKEQQTQENQNRSIENKRLINQILELSKELENWKLKFQGLESQHQNSEKVKRAHITQISEEKQGEIESLRREIMELRRKTNIEPMFNLNENDIRVKYEAQITNLETKIMTLEVDRDQLKQRIDEGLREIRGLKDMNFRLEGEVNKRKQGGGGEMINMMKENEELKSRLLVFYMDFFQKFIFFR